MKPIKIKRDFTMNNEYYFKGDTLERNLTYEQIVKLNEKGYIEPLSIKDLQEIKKGNKIEKKEE